MKNGEEMEMSKIIERLGFDRKTFIRFFMVVMNAQMIYAFIDLKAVLYDPFIEALGVTNTQFGVLMGFIGFISTFGGAAVGWLQDRFSIRKILAVNSFMYGTWALIMSLLPGCPYALKCLFFISFGFNGDAMYWATVLKSVRTLAKEDKQATAFGMLKSGRAIWQLIINGIAVAIYTALGSTLFGMRTVMSINACLTIFSGFIVWIFIPEEKQQVENPEKGKTQVAFSGFIKVLKMPAVWMTGLSAMCVYAVSCAAFTYFVPYLKNVYILPAALVGVFGLVSSSGTRIIAGPVAGIVADMKFKSSAHMMRACHIGLTIMLAIALVLPKNEKFVILAMACLLVVAIFVALVRSVYYAPIGEMGVPKEMSAAAMAVAACIGYSPSFWAYPLYGYLIDSFETSTAYSIIFSVLLIMTIAGIILNTLLGKQIVKRRSYK